MTDPGSKPTDLNERERSSLPIEHYAENMTPVETIPPQEPLFNKKVMVLWALGALAVWFAISFVVPVAKQSAKEAIIQSVKEAEKQSGGSWRPAPTASTSGRTAPRWCRSISSPTRARSCGWR